MARLKIGQVAKASGLSVETIRYYEQRGLLETPLRSPSGYREYSGAVIERLAFIGRGKHLGFSLEEIRDLLQLQLAPEADSASVKRLVEEKVGLVEEKIGQLVALKNSLARLSALCDGEGSAQDCPILEFLKQGGQPVTDAPCCQRGQSLIT